MKNNVKEIRESRLLTQSQLAKMIDVQVQTIWNIEHSKNRPRFSTMKKLAQALGVTVGELFGEDEEKPAA